MRRNPPDHGGLRQKRLIHPTKAVLNHLGINPELIAYPAHIFQQTREKRQEQDRLYPDLHPEPAVSVGNGPTDRTVVTPVYTDLFSPTPNSAPKPSAPAELDYPDYSTSQGPTF